MKLTDWFVTKASWALHQDKRQTIDFSRLLKGKKGLEIGGPSLFFGRKSYFPAYLYADRVDGVNFNTTTVWEGKINGGWTYKYLTGRQNGYQYITEASELEGVPDASYDFLLSCHSMEHLANPLKALKRWREVLKNEGVLVLVLPNKEVTFDHQRPYTTFEHLLEDCTNNVTEADTSHFAEVVQLHDIEKDPGVRTFEELEKRTIQNFSNRCVHHHVFSFETIKTCLSYCGFEVLLQKKIHEINLFTLARKI